MKRSTRCLLIVSAIMPVLVWYTVMLCLPKIGHGAPALTERVGSNLRWLAASDKAYEDVKRDIETLRWEDSRLPNKYVPSVTKVGADSWTLVATPERDRTYVHGLLRRWLTLNFDQHEYPTFTIKKGDTHPDREYPKRRAIAAAHRAWHHRAWHNENVQLPPVACVMASPCNAAATPGMPARFETIQWHERTAAASYLDRARHNEHGEETVCGGLQLEPAGV